MVVGAFRWMIRRQTGSRGEGGGGDSLKIKRVWVFSELKIDQSGYFAGHRRSTDLGHS